MHVAQCADHQWNAEWADSHTSLRTFIPDTVTHAPRMTLPRRACVRPPPQCWTFPLVLVQTGYGLFLRPVSVAQKNKPSAMLSSNVQSIDLPTDCMA